MAGFFGFFDYTKPGKGVDPDEPPKHAFFLFFELFWRKFSRMILFNFLYFLLLTPLITFGLLCLLQPGLLETGNGALSLGFLAPILVDLYAKLGVFFYVPVAIALIVYGPVTCGYTYVLRNFARQEHAWNSDFFQKAKENFKQGLFLGLLDAVVLAVFFFNMIATVPGNGHNGALLLTVSRYASFIVMVVYLCMRHYTYLLTVTFALNIRQILKNAWIFSVLGLWRNILILVVNGALILAAVLIHPLAELIAVPLFLFSFTGFVSVFTAYPVLKKYMIELPAQKALEEQVTQEENGDA